MSIRILLIGWMLLVGAVLSADEPSTDLTSAAERQEYGAAEQLLSEGADPNHAQVDGMTALHWATYHDNVELATTLLEAHADPNAANRYGVTPLSLACTNGNGKLVELLLSRGADPKATLRGGETALMTAARTGVVSAVDALLARGADVNAKDRQGQTAIMWAAAEGHAEVVQKLIDAGADFRTQLPSGFTPLFFAAREGQSEAVKVLLAAGADVNEGMRPQRKPAGRAPAQGTSPLLIAVENGHFELATVLLEAGADPNDQRSGFTALHVLSWVRKPNRGDGLDGEPPPIGSGDMTSLQFVRKLAEHGADVNAQLIRGASGPGVLNRKGATPFLLAAKTADLPFMRLLVELGADPHIPNADNCPPLLAAAGIGTLAPGEEAGTEADVLEAIDYIISLGGDVNAVDENGETAMHGAAYKSLPKVVARLHERGIKVELWNTKNKYGWTPLLIAEGYRVGNFKPSVETIDAIQRVLQSQ